MIAPLFILLLSILGPSSGNLQAMGPPGKVDIYRVDECEEKKGMFKMKFTKDAQNRKTFDLDLNLPSDFTDKWTFLANIHKWTGSEYKKNMMKIDGKSCEYLNRYIPDVVDRIYKLAKLKGNCSIKKGKYEAKGIHATEKDVKVPSCPYGKYRVDLDLYDAKKVKISCVIIDLEIKAK